MPQPLPSKEHTLFRSLVKFYEGKLYKKGRLQLEAKMHLADPARP
jgi:hypothetical protein